MFTDMVGYSGLIQRNESLGLELLAEQRAVVRKILPLYTGREVDTAGDAFFVEFGSALEATECAIHIQKTLRERNASLPGERHIVLRIGLHLGDVVLDGDQVQGDGVNIAARMEPLARPGSICISEDVARQVHNKIDLQLAPLGSKQLKNIRLPMNAFRVVMPWEEDAGTAGRFPDFAASAPRPKGWKPPRWAQITVVAAVLAGVGAFFGYRLLGSGGAQVEGLSTSLVAVLPFSVQGSPEFAYLGKGMVDLLSTKLDGAGPLRAVDPRAVHGLVTQLGDGVIDPKGGGEIARRLGAGSYVMGNIFEVGGRLRIDAAVYRHTASAQGDQGTVEGSATEIFDLLDRLAAQLVGSGHGVALERLQSMTTSSFDALKHYLQGVSAFRVARFQTAADELKQAVALDSTFALAWYQLSATADWLFDAELALTSAQNAVRHSGRLSERGRRLVTALEAAKMGRSAQAFQSYRDFLTQYPDDVEAWYQLGELVFHAGPIIGIPPQESLEAWNRLLFYEKDQITALIHMARVWLMQGQFAKVDSVASVIFAIEPEAERNVELRTHLAFNRQGLGAIDAVSRELNVVGDDMLIEVIWSLAAFRNDPAPALASTSVLTVPTRSVESQGIGLVLRAYLLAARGRFQQADETLVRAVELGYGNAPAHRAFMKILPFRPVSPADRAAAIREITAWKADEVPNASRNSGWVSSHNGIHRHLRDYLLGILHAQEGRIALAMEMAERLEAANAPRRSGSLVPDLALAVRAEIALYRGSEADAVRLLGRAKRHAWYQYSVSSPFFSGARERFLAGRLLEQAGEADNAIRSMSFFRGHSAYDWMFIAPAHYRLGLNYQSLGQGDIAAEHLRAFVELWKDGDEELQPVVEDARARLSELAR